jgi:putative SOS response-associated peptidase YedK
VQRLSPDGRACIGHRGIRGAENQDPVSRGTTEHRGARGHQDYRHGAGELVQRRWSWPSPTKKAVYNFRSEDREFTSNRCLIIADGFYEFTAPADPKKKRKDKWLFRKVGEPIFAIAGILRETEDVGEAYTMLTMEPGPDIAPYHDRQIVILERDSWADWLDPSVSAKPLIKPLPAGSLSVEQVG